MAKNKFIGIKTTKEQAEIWLRAASKDHRTLSSWVRVQCDKAVEKDKD